MILSAEYQYSVCEIVGRFGLFYMQNSWPSNCILIEKILGNIVSIMICAKISTLTPVGIAVRLHVTQIKEVTLYLQRIVRLRDTWRKESKLIFMNQ